MKPLYRTLLLRAGLVLIHAVAYTVAHPPAAWAAGGEWRVVYPQSRIGFVATYDGIPFEARFESFEARIEFSPERLDDAVFDVRIDVSSVDSDSVDRDEGMQEEEWLAADAHPVARFEARQFEALDGGRYEATGTLSLKEATKEVTVPFEWREESGGSALLIAGTTLERDDFNIGTGEWAEDDTIGFEVKVEARFKLTRPP